MGFLKKNNVHCALIVLFGIVFFSEPAFAADTVCKINGKCYQVGDAIPTEMGGGVSTAKITAEWMESNCKVQSPSENIEKFTTLSACQGVATNPTQNSQVAASRLHEMASGLNKLKVDNVQAFIGILIKGAMGVVGTIAFVMLVYGGVLWMTARGNAEQISKAEGTIVWSTLGIVLIFASYALVGFIFEIFR